MTAHKTDRETIVITETREMGAAIYFEHKYNRLAQHANDLLRRTVLTGSEADYLRADLEWQPEGGSRVSEGNGGE